MIIPFYPRRCTRGPSGCLARVFALECYKKLGLPLLATHSGWALDHADPFRLVHKQQTLGQLVLGSCAIAPRITDLDYCIIVEPVSLGSIAVRAN